MPLPKRRITRAKKTKQTYLGSGAGSLKSGTGTTAKAKKPKRFPFGTPRIDFFPRPPMGEIRPIPRPPMGEIRPITPKSPATGLGSVFEKQKTRKKRTATTMRRRAKR
jgi:hypothetical protein